MKMTIVLWHAKAQTKSWMLSWWYETFRMRILWYLILLILRKRCWNSSSFRTFDVTCVAKVLAMIWTTMSMAGCASGDDFTIVFSSAHTTTLSYTIGPFCFMWWSGKRCTHSSKNEANIHLQQMWLLTTTIYLIVHELAAYLQQKQIVAGATMGYSTVNFGWTTSWK